MLPDKIWGVFFLNEKWFICIWLDSLEVIAHVWRSLVELTVGEYKNKSFKYQAYLSRWVRGNERQRHAETGTLW